MSSDSGYRVNKMDRPHEMPRIVDKSGRRKRKKRPATGQKKRSERPDESASDSTVEGDGGEPEATKGQGEDNAVDYYA